ncbi:MAG: zinc ribbon domain-containing protein [Christensenellales bacterium]|jgi:hypothetical protein
MTSSFVGAAVALIFLLLAVILPVCVGVAVYRDARSRGMEAGLWTLVALITPGLIGLIIYLAVRREHPAAVCAACGAPVKASYVACPGCGAPLKLTCEQCGRPVEADWRVCAHCAAPLPEGRAPRVVQRSGGGGRGLWVLLVCVIALLVLVLAAVIIGSLSYAGFAGSVQAEVTQIAP